MGSILVDTAKCILKILGRSLCCGTMRSVCVSVAAGTQFDLAQWVKDTLLPQLWQRSQLQCRLQLWLGSDPCPSPGTPYATGWPKKKKKKKERKYRGKIILESFKLPSLYIVFILY